MVNGWKVTAIIFMVLFAIVVGVIALALVWVSEDVAKENECIFNVCENTGRYLYYTDESLCECYTEDFELIKQRYLK
jgi:uncharacterized protein YacL (UPF0231 family)